MRRQAFVVLRMREMQIYFTMDHMATYAIGDVQGCADSLAALVHRLPFRPQRDRLWFVGDLVNRGPKSADVLRMIRAAGPSAQVVLGNHDFHLLAMASGARPVQASDTVSSLLREPDAEALVDWLRHQPLCLANGPTLMVHAGLLPEWSARQALTLSDEVSKRLRSKQWKTFLHDIYGNSEGRWRESLRGSARHRMVVNVMTRMRYLQPNGQLDFKCKVGPSLAPEELTPWFERRRRQGSSERIVFGHWSTLGLMRRPGLIATDTGCGWGGYLSAVRLEDEAIFQQPAIDNLSSSPSRTAA